LLLVMVGSGITTLLFEDWVAPSPYHLLLLAAERAHRPHAAASREQRQGNGQGQPRLECAVTHL
ncbi:MAG: hypothetical protein J0I48_21270, partial [Devosia sp.]|nr:hypothetical protein [Devosia sp.]